MPVPFRFHAGRIVIFAQYHFITGNFYNGGKGNKIEVRVLLIELVFLYLSPAYVRNC